jgi:hypothetical protein
MQSLVHTLAPIPPSGQALATYATPRRFVAGRSYGEIVVKAATVRALAAIRGQSEDEVIASLYEKRRDERLVMLVRAATGTADTTTPGWARELVAVDVQGFLSSLPGSVFAALAQRGFMLDEGGVSVPFRASGDVAGAFVGEGGAAPVKRATLAAATLARHKMLVISTLTEELRRATGGKAEAIIRALLETDTASALDAALLDGAAEVPGVRPASLVNGVAPIAPSAAVSRAERIAEDVGAIVAALVAAGCTGPFVLAMNDAQKIGMTLACPGSPALDVIVSPNVPPGSIYGVDTSQFAATVAAFEFDVSNSVVLVMANADAIAPTHATSAADATAIGTAEQVPPDGGLSVVNAAQAAAGKAGAGSVAVSMFQTYSLALRTLLPCSWAKGRAGSVQWVQGVDW